MLYIIIIIRRRIPSELTITKTTVVEDDDIIKYKWHSFKNIPDPKVSL